MIVLINKATKLSDAFLKLPKEYMAKIQFGIETDTLDIEGKIISQKDPSGLSINNINKVLNRFKGPIKQIPPMYSAIKLNGKPLYKIARMGRSVERKTRDVEISCMEAKDFDDHILTIKVCCSSGTYIRTLAGDIGKALGTVAVLYSLERSKIGKFCLKGSIELKDISDIEKINTLTENNDMVVSIEKLLGNNPSIFIKAGHEKAIVNGKRISPGMIDFKKTDVKGFGDPGKGSDQDLSSMVLIRDFSGSILAVHGIIEKIKFEDMESFEQEFTKSIVIF